MAISARSRRSRTVSVGMASSSLRHSLPSSTGVLPVFTTCFGPRTADGRVCRHHLAGDQPVEQHPHGGELLLHARRRMGLLECLDISGDIERPDRGQRQAAIVAPGEELAAGPRIGPARVRVADVGGEEFDVAPGGLLAGVGDQRRHEMAAVGQGRRAAPG